MEPEERRDVGGSCGVRGGPGVRFTTVALASIIRDVTLTGRKKDVFREEVKRAVRRKSAMPWEKSGRKPMQSARDPDALRRYSGLSSAL